MKVAELIFQAVTAAQGAQQCLDVMWQTEKVSLALATELLSASRALNCAAQELANRANGDEEKPLTR